eukprot:gene12753-16003_t
MRHVKRPKGIAYMNYASADQDHSPTLAESTASPDQQLRIPYESLKLAALFASNSPNKYLLQTINATMSVEPRPDPVSDDDEDDDDELAPTQEDEWDDWEGSQGDEEPTKSLFGPEVLPTPEEAIAHDAKVHGFDIRQYAVQEVAAGKDPLAELKAAGSAAKSVWVGSDDYLLPVMQEDPLLFMDYDEYTSLSTAVDQGQNSIKAFLRHINHDQTAEQHQALLAPHQPRSNSAGAGHATTASNTTPTKLNAEAKDVDGAYFDSYSGFGIHKEMISDTPRTESYQKALEQNPSLIKGAVVMDVGCGTGILSLFAARAGASRVVAIDGSKRIADYAKKICALNGYCSESGGPMSIVQGKVEEIQDMPVDKVDVIVSEWMGYALLFETMLDTVLYARDKYLKPGGAVLPDMATIHVAGGGAAASGSTWWKDVYGFEMSPIQAEMHKMQLKEANVMVVKKEDIVTDSIMVKSEDQDFSTEFTLKFPSSAVEPVEVHSIVLWFDTAFSERFCSEVPVLLSTSPMAVSTHWAQTLLVLREPVLLGPPGSAAADGSSPASASCLTGRISMVRNRSKHRSLDISLEYKAELSDGKVIKHAA